MCVVRLQSIGNIIKRTMHFKCRNSAYPRSTGVDRVPVPDEKVTWDVAWEVYKPTIYTSPQMKGASWADPELDEVDFNPKWNSLDNRVNRESHIGPYVVDKAPLNPKGRTGLAGRGCLGRWGPNHAADPIVTRWLRSSSGEKESNNKTTFPILQFVAIQRRDCQQWAIPGGMVDPGEIVTSTLQREFLEEALNSLERNDGDAADIVSTFFKDGTEVYKGYVDDPRNTDNAWMETVAVNFHDEDGTSVGAFPLEAGDDAQKVAWMDLHRGIDLYASHRDMLQEVAKLHGAHW